ncbi:MAG: 30S ribosome-binding factor RbfA [Saprospiraceae bacterium]|nr:30S ribosome-binding factor RbfA [Saprospiraceae bacterium]MCB9325147.1 30S ribosome-binding factor RbfA [Lewinellaceae bacterium]
MEKETKRQKQTAELVKRHFSIVLQQEGSYIYGMEPLVTVTSVKMSPDLGLAKIYLSIYNTEDKQAVLLEMEAVSQKLRQSLSQRIKKHVRRIPNISFFIDETVDEMYRVDSLFDKLYEENQMGNDEEDEDESE